MNPNAYPLALWPAEASASALETDLLIWGFTILTLFLVVPIFLGITFFAVRYREGRTVNRAYSEERDRLLELGWMIIPFLLTLTFFAWGARMFIDHKTPVANATEIQAIGRQWMWKFQHPGGQAEINDLHVPVDEAIRINMISQDVIHALYIPALRIQMETLPGRYTQLSFKANRAGEYRILCTEFCGTDHSTMVGMLYVMTPADYGNWLTHAGSAGSLANAGERLFSSFGCSGCHTAGSQVRAPSLIGLFGKPVPLEGGGSAIADETYIRDKILNPDRDLVAGYKQVMPAFKGIVGEDDMIRLIAYIKRLGAEAAP